jgi:hypothetical protein
MHSIGLQIIKFGPTCCLGIFTFSADPLGLMALLFFNALTTYWVREKGNRQKSWNYFQVEIDLVEECYYN